MKRSSMLRLVLIFGCMAAILAGCSRDPNVRKQKYFDSGERYFSEGRVSGSHHSVPQRDRGGRRLCRGTLQAGPVVYQTAGLATRLRELTRTIELQPDNYKARVDLTRLLLLDGQPDHLKAAQDQVDVLMEKQPIAPTLTSQPPAFWAESSG